MADALFPAPQKERLSPLGWVEPSVNFLKESTRPEAVVARAGVNARYAEFPDPDGKLRSKLRSVKDEEFHTAHDELFVHHLLTCDAGREVRYEEGGTGPDFRTYRAGVPEAALEVVSLYQRADWTDEERAWGRIADGLDQRLQVTKYMLNFEVRKLDHNPSLNKLAAWVQEQIETLPEPGTALALHKPGSAFGGLPNATYKELNEEGGYVQLDFTFLPLRGDAPAKDLTDARIVGLGATVGGMVNSGKRLRERLKSKKVARYGVEDLPYAVVAGIHDTFCSRYSVEEALYGSEAVIIATGAVRRENSGLFGADKEKPNGRHRGIAAVAVIQFQLWAPDEAKRWMLDNPYAAQHFPDGIIPTTHRFQEKSRTATGFTFEWSPEEPPDH